MPTVKDVRLGVGDVGQIVEDQLLGLAQSDNLRDRAIPHQLVIVLVKAVILPVSCLPPDRDLKIVLVYLDLPRDAAKDSKELIGKGGLIACSVLLPRLLYAGQLLLGRRWGMARVLEQLFRTRHDFRIRL